ncbi:hypothetical protein BDW62DRAFT_203128 [Aspergillus aurantiobrunneus]
MESPGDSQPNTASDPPEGWTDCPKELNWQYYEGRVKNVAGRYGIEGAFKSVMRNTRRSGGYLYIAQQGSKFYVLNMLEDVLLEFTEGDPTNKEKVIQLIKEKGGIENVKMREARLAEEEFF